MANMSYCRFRNTVEDLEDCLENFDICSNGEEIRARRRLVVLCRQIVGEAERIGIGPAVDK
jgi:hypothetical protein